jgi:uncharacterized protein (DUF2267 family)
VARASDETYDDAWRYGRFSATVQQVAGVPPEQVERAARATLETLAERISDREARHLAGELPATLRAWLERGAQHGEPQPTEDFHVEDFIRRIARREEVDPEMASRHARAVFIGLARVVPGHELDHLVAELPHEYEPLLGDVARRVREAGPAEPLSPDEFVARVAHRAGLDLDAARQAVRCSLATLAERIAGGEVDDLAAALPEQLRPALERGKARTGGNARRMSLDEFIALIAEREDVSYEEAFAHARAVFATLREALPPKEVSDILAQLPRGYQEALL